MRQAAKHQWPLLIITTHWKAPWQAHLKGVTLEEGKPWRKLVDELESEESIPTPAFHELKLNKVPANDLRSIIVNLLPGLSSKNQDEILSMVDNVRWLVEVLNALSDNHEYFEGNYRGYPLSSFGQRRLDELL